MRISWKVPALLFLILAALPACEAGQQPVDDKDFGAAEAASDPADSEVVLGEPAESQGGAPSAEVGAATDAEQGGDTGAMAESQPGEEGTGAEMEQEPAQPEAAERSQPMAAEPKPAPRTAPQAGMQDQPLSIDSAREQMERRQAKREVLSREFVQQGHDAYARGDYSSAAALYADAFQLAPNNQEARDGLRRAEGALGRVSLEAGSGEELLDRAQLRWARERLNLENQITEGDRLMAAGDFHGAADRYQAAYLILQNSPNLQGGSLDVDVLNGKLQAALAARDDAALAEEAMMEARANMAARDEAEARREYFDNRIATLFAQANQEFSMGYYEQCIETLEHLLDLDPDNEDAVQLLETAQRAYLAQEERHTAAEYREEWRRTFEELRTIAVPPAASIEFDKELWREKVAHRKPVDAVIDELEENPEVLAIEAVLDETRIEPRFENSVEEIAANLAAYTRINYVVSRAVREDLDEDTKTVRFSQNRPMAVSKLHSIIEDLTNNEVRFVIRDGVVNVVTPEEAKGAEVLRIYEVRDIVRRVQDFVGKEINLSPSGGIDEIEELLPEREATILTEDDLLEAIQTNIAPNTWDDTGSVTIENGTLVVFNTPVVHTQIRRLLDDLRRATNIMVEIKVRFLMVEDSFLEDIGVDFRGLGNQATAGVPGKGSNNVFDDFGSDPGSPAAPGEIGTDNTSGAYFRESGDDVNIIGRTENLYDASLGDERVLTTSGGLSLQYTWLDDTQVNMVLRAVEKSKRSQVVTEPKLMIYNTARANLTIANQVSYVGDFDVQIAQAAAIADPIVRVAQDGVFLDVRPTVSADRRFIFLVVRPTVARLQRPIPTFQTSLGTGSPVTLQLPELEMQKVRAPVMIPDGGTLLLGGMKMVEQQELRSGVPFLQQVPILSFFFSRQGSYQTYRKLIILLTATIIIPGEYEPDLLDQ